MRLSRPRTFAYSAGQFAAGLYFAFNTFILSLYLSQFTQNNILIGWLSSTRSFEQSIIQPIVGATSDRLWTRLGRRAPFFLIGMPIVALLFIFNGALRTPPQPTEPQPEFTLVVATIFLFSLIFNLGIDPYYALLVDVTSPEQRGRKSGWAQMGGFLGQCTILIFAIFLWTSQPFLVWLLVALGLVGGFGCVALFVRERRELNPEAKRDSLLGVVLFMLKIVVIMSLVVGVIIGGLLGLYQWLGIVGLVLAASLLVAGVLWFLYARGMLRYLGRLWVTQREPSKLLGVKFLYQFGINAAVPFLTLFIRDEIGLNGWDQMQAAVPFLAAIRLDVSGMALAISFVFLIMQLLWAAPCGWLGDKFGKKRIFALGLAVMGVTALLSAFATTIPQILFYLIFLSFGNTAQTVLFGVYMADLIPLDRVGEFTGLSASAETIGVFGSALVAGALINLNLYGLQYRMIFILTGIFLLLAVLAVQFVKARVLIQTRPLAPTPTG